MKRTAWRSSLLLAACCAAAGVGARAQNAPPPPRLLERLIASQKTVKTYTANVHADITMHTFPFLNPSLDGVYYHEEPSRNKIVFTSGLPFIAREFSKIYPQVESPSRWEDVYDVSDEGDSGGATTFKLVPRKQGRIDHIDAKVDDRTAELIALRWNYNDGGYATLDQTYGQIDGHAMVTKQTGHVEVPHWTADLLSTFSNFKINVPIPNSVFAQD